MTKYTTILFDLDGTLLNTLEDLTDSVNYVLKKFKLPERTQKEIRSYLGNGYRKLLALSLPDGEENPKFEEIYNEYKTYYFEHCLVKTKPYLGISELLGVLKEKGYDMAIVSNKNDLAVKELHELFFADTVQLAVGEREGAKRKPAPDLVFYALHELGRKAEETLYVGDSEVDFQTAKNAGLDCALVSWGFRDREDLERLHAMSLVDQPKELLGILR